ncbi:MAG: class I SAM-dependent methyltransferase [Desulfovibrio sp.]|nr:MAG: class I SAM-dependent methyltransferase [Desulfovibrio sp.]
MIYNDLSGLLAPAPEPQDLWAGNNKIPWNDPDFSSRMLEHHLSQDHDLASRRTELIQEQSAWICERLPALPEVRILDLGCGPGLYAPHLSGPGRKYLGLDFGPASIAHARKHFQDPGKTEFELGDMRSAPLGVPHHVALLLYGELNVFSPEDCRTILASVHAALEPGGMLFVEMQTQEAVEKLGQENSWYATPSGLFSQEPHVCLTQGLWYPEQRVALQRFHVVDPRTASLQTYDHVTQAWGAGEVEALLDYMGFCEVTWAGDWPSGNKGLKLITARKQS